MKTTDNNQWNFPVKKELPPLPYVAMPTDFSHYGAKDWCIENVSAVTLVPTGVSATVDANGRLTISGSWTHFRPGAKWDYAYDRESELMYFVFTDVKDAVMFKILFGSRA